MPDTDNVTYFVQILLRWGGFRPGPIKIGTTRNFPKRYELLIQNHYEFLEILCVVPQRVASERLTHTQFKQHRLRYDREWFAPTPALLKFIASLAPHDVGYDKFLHYGRHGRIAVEWDVPIRTCVLCTRTVKFWRRPETRRKSPVAFNEKGIDQDYLKLNVLCPVCGGDFGWTLDSVSLDFLKKHEAKLQAEADARGMPLIEYIRLLEQDMLDYYEGRRDLPEFFSKKDPLTAP